MCCIYTTECTEGPVLLKRQTTLSRFLSVPDLRGKQLYEPKSSARVLTSVENLQRIEKKEKLQKEKEALKKERQRKREEKQLLKYQGPSFILRVACIMHTVYNRKFTLLFYTPLYDSQSVFLYVGNAYSAV